MPRIPISNKLKKIVEVKETIPLSNHDIMRGLKNMTNIITYRDLKNINNIEDVLHPYGTCIILYQNTPESGHWVVLNSRKNGCYEFFDSYGMYPDDQLKYANYYLMPKKLLSLLKKTGVDVVYNPFKLQSDRKDSNVCGRWCVLRTLLKDIPLLDFVNLFMDKEKNPDFYCTLLTRNL